MTTYVYDTSLAIERERLHGLEASLDPDSIAHLEVLGVGPGWRCLEVGAGRGSVARWLCERVGPDGHIVATDLDTHFLDEIGAPNLEVRAHDIVADPLEKGAFDFVYARAVLEHLPGYGIALAKMIDALKPSGWILLEDVDFLLPVTASPRHALVIPASDTRLFAKVMRSTAALLRAAGADVELGRRLPRLLAEAGLENVDAAGRWRLARGGSTQASMIMLGIQEFRTRLVEGGYLTEGEIARACSLLGEPRNSILPPAFVAAWGRKAAVSI